MSLDVTDLAVNRDVPGILWLYLRTMSNLIFWITPQNLRGHDPPVYVNQQYPAEINRRRNILRPILKLAKSLKMNASMSGDRLLINGVWYTSDNLDKIPISSTDLEAISTRYTEEYVIFHGRMSPFSNFRSCYFTIDGVKYSCVEQYFQKMKAIHVNDHISAAEIMITTDPGKMKSIGYRVKSPKSWDTEKLIYMETGLIEKFKQNPDLLEKLLGTGQRFIAEASVRDTFWGIGRGLTFDNVADPSTWTGKNELGKLLVQIRDKLANDEQWLLVDPMNDNIVNFGMWLVKNI